MLQYCMHGHRICFHNVTAACFHNILFAYYFYLFSLCEPVKMLFFNAIQFSIDCFFFSCLTESLMKTMSSIWYVYVKRARTNVNSQLSLKQETIEQRKKVTESSQASCKCSRIRADGYIPKRHQARQWDTIVTDWFEVLRLLQKRFPYFCLAGSVQLALTLTTALLDDQWWNRLSSWCKVQSSTGMLFQAHLI